MYAKVMHFFDIAKYLFCFLVFNLNCIAYNCCQLNNLLNLTYEYCVFSEKSTTFASFF